MKLLILRTNIKTKKKVKVVKPLFNNNPIISKWSIDLEDIDNVLKIEAQDDLKETDLIHLVKTAGFYCEPLAD